MSIVEALQLTRRFGDLTAVDALSFAVGEGEIFALVGSDGAGKTTTLRMLAGIMDPTSGEARVLGTPMTGRKSGVQERIGYMSQRFGLYADLTVQENIDFYADIHTLSRGQRRERIDELLGFSNLHPFRRRLAGNLSGGMKQKLGLACALVHSPRILLLDEPTNGVDPVSRRDFWRILYRLLSGGVTIVVATAYLDEAERCSRVALMHRGKLLACDTPRGLRALAGGSILEIRCETPRRAARLLREELAGSVGLFGDRVHLLAAEPERLREPALRLLERSGIAVDAVRGGEPSLEDVFVNVLGEA